jgi:predicted DNA-binding protein (MmcQ/YjbR family)
MNLDSLRDYCLSLPDATEQVQWGNDLVFKIGGKMFAVACLEPVAAKVSFKCTPERFTELVEREHIRPADYVGRYQWVTLESWSALPDRDIKQLVKNSYEMVKSKVKGQKAKIKKPPGRNQTSRVKRTAQRARRVARG